MPRVIILPDGTQIIAGDAIETYVSQEDKEKTQKFDNSLIFHKETYLETTETDTQTEDEDKDKDKIEVKIEKEVQNEGLIKITTDIIETIEENKLEAVDPVSGIKTRVNRKKKNEIAPITSVVENGNEVKVNEEIKDTNTDTDVNVEVTKSIDNDNDIDLDFQVK